MNISPTTQECLLLLDRYGFPEEKKPHLFSVMANTVYLTRHLQIYGIPIIESFMVASSLLHDIDKGVPGVGVSHPNHAVNILKHEGFDEIAAVVAKHSLQSIIDPVLKPESWEERILFLADKMAKLHPLTVDQRFDLWRNEGISDLTRVLDATYVAVKSLENDMCSHIRKTPKQIVYEVQLSFAKNVGV